MSWEVCSQPCERSGKIREIELTAELQFCAIRVMLFHYSQYKWSVFIEEKAHVLSAD